MQIKGFIFSRWAKTCKQKSNCGFTMPELIDAWENNKCSAISELAVYAGVGSKGTRVESFLESDKCFIGAGPLSHS